MKHCLIIMGKSFQSFGAINSNETNKLASTKLKTMEESALDYS